MVTFSKNDKQVVFSVRNHPGKFSQSKQTTVGKCKDLDCYVDGVFVGSVTMGLKPGKDGKDIPETATDVVNRLLDRVDVQLATTEIKQVAALL